MSVQKYEIHCTCQVFSFKKTTSSDTFLIRMCVLRHISKIHTTKNFVQCPFLDFCDGRATRFFEVKNTVFTNLDLFQKNLDLFKKH